MNNSYTILYDILKHHYYLDHDDMKDFLGNNKAIIKIYNNNVYLNMLGMWQLIFLVDRDDIIELLNPSLSEWLIEN
jgi:hypothetical protein